MCDSTIYKQDKKHATMTYLVYLTYNKRSLSILPVGYCSPTMIIMAISKVMALMGHLV